MLPIFFKEYTILKILLIIYSENNFFRGIQKITETSKSEGKMLGNHSLLEENCSLHSISKWAGPVVAICVSSQHFSRTERPMGLVSPRAFIQACRWRASRQFLGSWRLIVSAMWPTIKLRHRLPPFVRWVIVRRLVWC